MRQIITLGFIWLIGLAGCRQANPPTPSPLPILPTTAPTGILATFLPPPTPATTPSPTLTPIPVTLAPTATPTWAKVVPQDSNLSRPPNPEEQRSAAKFADSGALQRDDIQLAIAYLGLPAEPTPHPIITEPLPVGTQQSLYILNIDNNTVGQINAELKAVSDYAYFWFDLGAGGQEPELSTLQNVAYTFDRIYEAEIALFGSENNPGIDGDPACM